MRIYRSKLNLWFLLAMFLVSVAHSELRNQNSTARDLVPQSNLANVLYGYARVVNRHDDTRMQGRYLEVLSLDKVTKERLLDEFVSNSSADDLRAFRSRLKRIRDDLRANPVSYGRPGGFRMLSLLGVILNVHIMLHGFNSSFILPELRNDWAMVAHKADALMFGALTLAGFADYSVYRNESAISRDYKQITRKVQGTLDDLDGVLESAIQEAETHPRTQPIKKGYDLTQRLMDWLDTAASEAGMFPEQNLTARHTDELTRIMGKSHDAPATVDDTKKALADYWTTALPSERLDLHRRFGHVRLQGMLPEFDDNHSEDLRKEERLERIILPFLRENPQSLHDLYEATLINEADYLARLAQHNKMTGTGKLALWVLGINAVVWGALTNLGLSPTAMDWPVVDQMFRDTLNSPMGKTLGLSFMGAGVIWAISFPARLASRFSGRKQIPNISGEDWRLVRRVIMKHAYEVGAPLDPSLRSGTPKSIDQVMDKIVRVVAENPNTLMLHPPLPRTFRQKCRDTAAAAVRMIRGPF